MLNVRMLLFRYIINVDEFAVKRYNRRWGQGLSAVLMVGQTKSTLSLRTRWTRKG